MKTLEGLPPSRGTAHGLIEGAAGPIECLIAAPAEAPRGIALACHPHPLRGGEMSNKVTYTLASVALNFGLVSARFNFRGVGASGGTHDHARGEAEDCLRVIEWLRAQLPDAPLMLSGFSFGAYVSLSAAARARPAVLVSVAMPFGKYFQDAPNPEHPGCPWMALHSRDDDVVDYTETTDVLAGYVPPPHLATVDGAGHFFHGRLQDLRDAVLPFLAEHWPTR